MTRRVRDLSLKLVIGGFLVPAVAGIAVGTTFLVVLRNDPFVPQIVQILGLSVSVLACAVALTSLMIQILQIVGPDRLRDRPRRQQPRDGVPADDVPISSPPERTEAERRRRRRQRVRALKAAIVATVLAAIALVVGLGQRYVPTEVADRLSPIGSALVDGDGTATFQLDPSLPVRSHLRVVADLETVRGNDCRAPADLELRPIANGSPGLPVGDVRPGAETDLVVANGTRNLRVAVTVHVIDAYCQTRVLIPSARLSD